MKYLSAAIGHVCDGSIGIKALIKAMLPNSLHIDAAVQEVGGDDADI